MKIDQKKVLATCFAALCIVLFLTYTIQDFDKEKSSEIRTLIGEEFSGISSLSVRENIILKNAVEVYLKNVASGDFDKAYGYLTAQYKEVVSKEQFVEKMTEIGLENFSAIKSLAITQVTTNMFMAKVILKNNVEQPILVILDNENYYIVPEPFLEYKMVNEEITKDHVTYLLNGYEVGVERCVFYFTITNNSSEEIQIVDAQMLYGISGQKQALNNEFTIPANESKTVSVEVETYLNFPTGFKIHRQDGNKLRIYTFEL